MIRNPEEAAANGGKVRFAVIGLGHIAQDAVLPAFANAPQAELAALISSDATKLKKLGKAYGIRHLFSYKDTERCFRERLVDAVYIALPNHLHCQYTLLAARHHIHVLCEKPMAVTEEECQRMIRACGDAGVKLMIAYRLHFERANLEAVRLIKEGRLGEPRFFNSVFSMQVNKGNIRLKRQTGGGTLFDIGIYCLNAARYLFRAEPTEVFALKASGDDARFREIEEMTGALLRFPGERLATFISSFGATSQAAYEVIGTKGRLRLISAYEYEAEIQMELQSNGRKQTRSFGARDQFAAELIHFSKCILEDLEPAPSGQEGLADVRIICALNQSAETGQPVKLRLSQQRRRPDLKQEIKRPPSRPRRQVRVQAPTID